MSWRRVNSTNSCWRSKCPSVRMVCCRRWNERTSAAVRNRNSSSGVVTCSNETGGSRAEDDDDDEERDEGREREVMGEWGSPPPSP